MVFWVWLVLGVLVAITLYVASEAERRHQDRVRRIIREAQARPRPQLALDGCDMADVTFSADLHRRVACLGCYQDFDGLREWAHHDCTALWWDAADLRQALLSR